jgi:lactoylglutathione lyase
MQTTQLLSKFGRRFMIATANNAQFTSKGLSSVAGEKRRFEILGLQQIAIGSLSKKTLTSFWVDLLGVEKVGSYRSEKENVDEDILTLGKGILKIEIDLMQPIDPLETPKVHIPALNHIGLWVDNLDNAVTDLTAKGVVFTPGGIRKGASGHNVSFIHPKSAAGVLVELVQAPDNVIAAFRLISI